MTKIEELLKLVKENPNLPIVPMVDSEVVGDYDAYWMGAWGDSAIEEIYLGRDRYYIKSIDDEEDVLNGMEGCRYSYTEDGRDIYELSDEEWTELYNSLPWEKCIVVYITTP